jgi:hypothetical protein
VRFGRRGGRKLVNVVPADAPTTAPSATAPPAT